MKHFITIGSILFILAATVWFFCLHASPLVISPETTYITAPLMPDGKRIDYFRAWEERAYPPEMKTDDNGYRILVRAIGDPNNYSEIGFGDKRGKDEFTMLELDPVSLRLQVYEKLGLDPSVPTTMKIECPYAFMGRYIEEHPEAAEQWWRVGMYRLGRPWTLDDLPQFKDWIAENEAGLNLLGEAVRQPVFRAPEVRNSKDETLLDMSGRLGRSQIFRNFARAVQARALYRTGIGDIDGAIDDVITSYLLARHVSNHRTHVDYLVGIAIESMAVSIHFGANPAAPPSRAQLQRLFDTIRALPPLPKIEDFMVVERFQALSVLQEFALGRKLEGYQGLAYGPWCAEVDWNFLFREMNRVFDTIIAGGEVETPWAMDIGDMLAGRQNDLVLWSESQPPVKSTVQERTEFVRDVFFSLWVPSSQMELVRHAERRRQCTENLKLLTLALLLYEKDHGKLPDGDWRVAVKLYLGDNANKYFRCPSGSAAEDETTYAMIRRTSGVMPHAPYTLLLVEVFPPMKMTGNDGTIPEAKAVYSWRTGEQPPEGVGSNHAGGFNISSRGGAVRFISTSASPAQWKALMEGTLADGL